MADELSAPNEAPEPQTPESGSPAEAPPPSPPSPDLADLKERLGQAERTAQTAQTEADAIKRYVVQLVSTMQQPVVDPAQQDANFRELLEKDPKAALALAADERVRPLLEEIQASNVQQGVERERLTAFQQLDQHPDLGVRADWQAYRGEVEQFMQGIPLDVQAKPGVWLSALRQVQAQHIDDIVKRRASQSVAQERQAALEGATGFTPRQSINATLSADELRMMKAFGMDEKEWRTHKAAVSQGVA